MDRKTEKREGRSASGETRTPIPPEWKMGKGDMRTLEWRKIWEEKNNGE